MTISRWSGVAPVRPGEGNAMPDDHTGHSVAPAVRFL